MFTMRALVQLDGHLAHPELDDHSVTSLSISQPSGSGLLGPGAGQSPTAAKVKRGDSARSGPAAMRRPRAHAHEEPYSRLRTPESTLSSVTTRSRAPRAKITTI
eukprot:12820889-Heterocapsa_arctica.AAC.1